MSTGKTTALVLHPFLFVAWFVADLFANNFGAVVPADVVIPLAGLLGASLLSFLVMWMALRNPHKAGLALTTATVMFLSYHALHELVSNVNEHLQIGLPTTRAGHVPHRYVAGSLALAGLFFFFYLWQTTRDTRSATPLFNLISLLLLAFALSRIGFKEITYWFSPGAQAEPYTQTHPEEKQPAKNPDIFYIVLDRYASSRTLLSAYNFNNDDFITYLKNKGFYVAEGSRSNYPDSVLSLWASLNMRYLPHTFDVAEPSLSLRRSHAVGNILKDRGYRYVHLGSWYLPTSSCENADVNVKSPTGWTEFTAALIRQTPLAVFFHKMNPDNHARTGLFQLRKLQEMPAGQQPLFVVAHILLPHRPFVFLRDGSRAQRDSEMLRKDSYIEQLLFTNSQMKEVLEAIFAKYSEPPILILQGDEGPHLREDDHEKPGTEQYRIRTGILNALFLPDSSEGLYQRMTPVNTFRILFSHYFGLDLPPVEDRVYFGEGASRWWRIFRSKDITEQVWE